MKSHLTVSKCVLCAKALKMPTLGYGCSLGNNLLICDIDDA